MRSRLSLAMMLGAATCKLEPYDINACAMGSALNAMGVRKITHDGSDYHRVDKLLELWPWLEEKDKHGKPWVNSEGQQIMAKFDCDVCQGLMTFEQLVDYVRSIEPNCDCNRFDCDCRERFCEESQFQFQSPQLVESEVTL